MDPDSLSHSVSHSELSSDVAMSQAADLQSVSLHLVNIHPMQTRSKSGIVKKKQAYSTHVHEDSSTHEPLSYFAASKIAHWKTTMQE